MLLESVEVLLALQCMVCLFSALISKLQLYHSLPPFPRKLVRHLCVCFFTKPICAQGRFLAFDKPFPFFWLGMCCLMC